MKMKKYIRSIILSVFLLFLEGILIGVNLALHQWNSLLICGVGAIFIIYTNINIIRINIGCAYYDGVIFRKELENDTNITDYNSTNS